MNWKVVKVSLLPLINELEHAVISCDYVRVRELLKIIGDECND